jgi:hypothetical protein
VQGSGIAVGIAPDDMAPRPFRSRHALHNQPAADPATRDGRYWPVHRCDRGDAEALLKIRTTIIVVQKRTEEILVHLSISYRAQSSGTLTRFSAVCIRLNREGRALYGRRGAVRPVMPLRKIREAAAVYVSGGWIMLLIGPSPAGILKRLS